MPRLTVRERLAPEITASLFANYRNAVDAILELIDNSVDSRLPDVGLDIELTMRTGSVQIVTVGGQGMGPQDVERRYLRWGSSGKRGRNLLGQYGQGGKAAVGYLGGQLVVEVSRPGDELSWRLEDREYRDRSRLKVYEMQEVRKRVDAELGYVRIRIDAVDRRVDVKRVTARIAETYRPLLEGGQVHVSLNGHRLQPPPIPTTERTEFRVRAGGVTLAGWVGVLPEGAGIDAGMRCYRLGRLVAGGEWFGHPGPAQSPGLARLVGEVEIPRLPLTMNKTDFDRDDPGWRAIELRMHRLLAPLVRRLAREEQPPPPASAVRAAEQVRKLLGQALRLIERNELFEGFEPGRRPVEVDAGVEPPQPELEMGPPAEPGAEADEVARGTEDEETPEARPDPRSPERTAASGERRRRGVGRIELRSLGDPAIRSLTLQEEGVTVIVINTQHPLFVERKGDVWYQLETAAREVTSSLEGLSLAEYERQVNQVLLLALGIRARRRTRRGEQPELRLLS
ncbi:MAG: ATP-binding protein [Candidatus Dormiibacterota bacterium]